MIRHRLSGGVTLFCIMLFSGCAFLETSQFDQAKAALLFLFPNEVTPRESLGELVIEKDGVYTRIFTLKHPKTKSIVHLVGTVHYADPAYYLTLQRFLDQNCEFVIYEGPPWLSETILLDWHRSYMDQHTLSGQELDAFFILAYTELPKTISERHQLVSERYAFNYKNPRWISGDGYWFHQRNKYGRDRFWDAAYKRTTQVPQPTREEIVRETYKLFGETDAGNARRKDLLQWHTLLFKTHARDMASLWNLFTKERSYIALTQVFDQIADLKKPKSVCLKYGWYHTVHQLEFLRNERGYRLERVSHIKAVTATPLP